jgi:hypothetical protein
MKTTLILSSLLMALAIPALPASAQASQCGAAAPDGRSYSATPCAEGPRGGTVADPRPAADVQAAKDVAQREHQLAQRLALDRRQREAVAPGAGLAGIGPRRRRHQACCSVKEAGLEAPEGFSA